MDDLGKEIYRSRPMTEIFGAAHIWLSRGFSLLPCQPGTKRLVRGFGPNLATITKGEEIDFWFRSRGANLAIVTGDNARVLDFDAIELYSRFTANWPDLARSYTEATPRGGRHTFFRLEPGDNLQIPFLEHGIEIKRICLVHPSAIGEQKYEILEPGPILTISRETLNKVLKPFFVGGDEVQPSPTPRPLGTPGAISDHKSSSSGNYGILGKAKAAWPILPFLTFFAPQVRLTGGDRWRSGRCPWHEDHNPSLWVDVVRNTWGCHSCGAHGDVVNWRARQMGTDDQLKAAINLVEYSEAVKIR